MKAWAIDDDELHFEGDEVADMFDMYSSEENN